MGPLAKKNKRKGIKPKGGIPWSYPFQAHQLEKIKGTKPVVEYPNRYFNLSLFTIPQWVFQLLQNCTHFGPISPKKKIKIKNKNKRNGNKPISGPNKALHRLNWLGPWWKITLKYDNFTIIFKSTLLWKISIERSF